MRSIVGTLGPKGSGKDTGAATLVAERSFVRLSFAGPLYQQVAEAFKVTEAYLGNRDTKETPMPELALVHCKNIHFVEVGIAVLTRSRSLRKAVMQYFLGAKHVPHVSRRRVKDILCSPRSPRWTMQLWGTEYRRKSKYGDDAYWLKLAVSIIENEPEKSFVITDVRFHNEADLVEAMGGVLVRIRRPVLEAREAADRALKGTAAHPSETELLNRAVYAELMNNEGEQDSLRIQMLKLVDGLPNRTERKVA